MPALDRATAPVQQHQWVWAGVLSAAGLMTIVLVAGLLLMKRRRSSQHTYPSLLLPPKQAVAVKNVNPKVVQSAAGLRQVISPVQSPLSTDSTPSPITPFHSLLEERTRKLSPGELPEHRGKIDFELAYDPCSYSLQVTVVGCADLCEVELSRDGQCLLDPYVKIQLLPDKEHRVKTRIVRSTTNPIYEEQFTLYGVGPEQINNAALYFQVVAFDRYSRDTVIGEGVYRLEDSDLTNQNNVKLSVDLRGEVGSESGEVLVSLTYQPAFNNLTAVILKARALPIRANHHIDPYVKLYLRKENGERLVKKKTHVKRGNQHPVYNESFVLELPEDKLDTALIDLQVVNHDRNNRNDVIGRALLNRDDPHVQEVLANPGRQVSKWHHLE
ncbi:unnamed protein product, partial [Mesorhabditis belari]|uniref:C2 domain-containing protein n=1 Tax=Mesorhabditis belari TaxID=2138241 RepID=A0AAF3ED71_9BILA